MKLISQRRYHQLVTDFEYEIINDYSIGEYVIAWQAQDRACGLWHNGKRIDTGSFATLLEHFVKDTQ